MSTIETFAENLSAKAVEYQDEPFQLRGGGQSHWYVDHRKGLNGGGLMYDACSLIIEKARELDIRYDRVAGAGVGGCGIAIVTGWLAGNGTQLVIANLNPDDDRTTNPKNGYGLHGGDVDDHDVLLVDDIGSTGSSLIELAQMVREHNGRVEHAINVSDRSKGRTAQALAALGIAYHALLEFDESTGLLVPMV